MFNREHLNDPTLKKLIVQVTAEQVLFRQGDKGNTMYIVVEGSLRLTQKVGQVDRLVGTLGAGEVIGERAVCLGTPYKRNCSAQANENTTLLEFDTAALKAIQAKAPDFSLKLLALVSSRLERMNRLVGILQIQEPVERVVHFLSFCAHHRGKKVSGGTEVEFSTSDASETLNVELSVVEDVLSELVAERLMTRETNKIIIPDENALISAASALKERIAA